MSSAAVAGPLPAGWLRNPRFDLIFIWVIAGVSVAAGTISQLGPNFFPIILFLDLWLLGYHHVVSTFTRIAFDKSSLLQHRFLVFGLPIIVLGGAFAVADLIGVWALSSTYLYWQWFHYTRQSWGVSQVYRRKANGLVKEPDWLLKAVIYLVPLWGILHRSWQAPDTFLMVEVRVIPTPGWLVDAAGLLAMAALATFSFRRWQAHARGEGPGAHTQYLISHTLVFLVGYILIPDLTYGWLTVNVWHNAQYILFVWMFNNNRFKGGVIPEAKFLSTISQSRNKIQYFVCCFAISTTLYFALIRFSGQILAIGIPSLIVIYQAINFHHYIVDSKIWKVRQRPMQKVLGLAKS